MQSYWKLGSFSGYCVEIGERVCGNLQRRRLKIFAKMVEGRCSGNHQDVRRAPEEPCKCNLHRCGVEARRHFAQGVRLQWRKPAEWKERNVGDAVASKVRDQRIVCPMGQVVLILNADDRDDPSRLDRK